MGSNDRFGVLLVGHRPENLSAAEAALSAPAASASPVPGPDLVRAAGAEEALALLASREFAVTLVDVGPSPVDGFEVAVLIRRDERFRHVAVVLLGDAATPEGQVRRALELGAADFLARPVDPARLRAKVAALAGLVRRSGERAARERVASILDCVTDAFIALDAEWRFTYANREAVRILGIEPSELLGHNHWELFPASVGSIVEREFRRAVAERRPVQFENFYGPLGRWFEVRAFPAEGGGLSVYFRDVTQRKRTESLMAGQRQVLERIVGGAPQAEILAGLCRAIEENTGGGVLASILLLDEDGRRLRHGAAPSLPDAYNRAIDGIAIGPNVGSCGSAAFRRETVCVADIASDPLWADFAPLALSHGLRACWSTPILSSAGRVLGTFAMYHRAPRVPSDEDLANIDIITRTATIAIERYRAERELRDRAERLRVTLASIGDAVVVTDARGHVTFLNAVAEGVTGWAMSEAEGRPLREVFRIINESTRAAVDSPVEKVLREGRIVGLANHTLLIRKDGREVPIDDSAAPIRDREDRISGVVLVFRDISERKETETALREGAQRLGLALSASGLGDWSWEAGTDVVTFSPRAAEIFGIPPGPVMTWTRMRELLHPEDRERARMGVERAVADHSDYDIEYRVARPEGGHRWVSARGRATYDPEGGVTGMLGVVQDIDARKREEEARADRESLTALRADVAEALSKSDSRDAALRACCEALVGWLGMAFARIWLLDPAEEVLELRASAGMYTRLDGTHARIRVGAFKIGRIARVRQPHLTNRLADDPFLGDPEWAGREGLTAFAGYPLTVGDRVVGVMAMFSRRAIPEGVFGELALVADGIAQFIDRKRLEEERQRLRVREMRRSRQFRELADAAAAANTLTSLDAALKVITEKALQIVGVHQAVTSMTVDLNWAQAINTVALSDKYAAWRDYSAPPDGSGIYSLVCRNNRTMRLTQAELEAHPAYRRFGKDAAAHPPMRGWLAAPLVGRNGRNLGLIQLSDKVDGGDFDEDDEAILIQLAQLASVAVENAWLYREAQEAARTKDEFLAVVSHELRTPMNAIVGWVQMLKSGQLNFLEGQQALEVVERNAKAQTQLINDLLDVSRIISGKMMLESRPVPLEAVVRAALDTVRLSAEAKGLRLEAAMEAGLPPVSGDADRLQQVVWNLLTNAVKFTPKGGQVTVALRRTNSHAEIAVRDNGQGIAAEFLPHIFGRFRQADAASTRKHGGLGLGLSIVRNLVELHGGTVRAESDGPGRGAAFTVTLPFRAVRSETEAEPEPEPEPEAGLGPRQAIPADGRAPRRLDGLRILIVDDEPDARMMVGTVLSKMGARVTAADSAREALRSLEDRLPDLLISDIGMPYQDGYELIRRVRALPPERGGRLPAIALTAFARAEDRERALAAGFQLHVPKPVEPAVLAAAVSGLVGSAAAEPVGAGG